MVILNWLLAHEAVTAALAVAVLDFVIEINPSLSSNSFLSMILSGLQKLLPQPKAPGA